MPLWQDDVAMQSGRDGSEFVMEGRFPYFISRNLLHERPTLLEDHKTVLTDYIRESGGQPVDLTTTSIDAIIARRPPTAKQKLDRILKALAREREYQAGTVTLVNDRQPVRLHALLRDGGVRDKQELISLLRYADTQGLAAYDETTTSARATLKVPGLIYVEELAQDPTESLSAFVAMWFAPEMLDAYRLGIAPAIEANGFTPVRVDQRDFNNRIDDEIIAEIRRARFVVADFSSGQDGARGGVYFEAGFGLALSKPVVFTVRAADIDRVHFDTRQFNHIVWNEPAELEEKLRLRIAATIPHTPRPQ